MAEGRWFPVYYEDLPKAVWHDPRLFWTWAHLLAIHDRSWPSPGDMPRGLSQSAIDELVRLELLTLMPHHLFEVRGVNARRNAQRNAGRIGATIRWANADPIRGRNAEAMPTKPNQTKPESLRISTAPETAAQILERVAKKAAEIKEAG